MGGRQLLSEYVELFTALLIGPPLNPETVFKGYLFSP